MKEPGLATSQLLGGRGRGLCNEFQARQGFIETMSQKNNRLLVI